ncbi:MAG: hypothetical protein NC388_05495 [Clostridium sp.]|nr:hypothetical protein [Clostridium sp.]
MKKQFLWMVAAGMSAAVWAQRPMERLDRGLVAVMTGQGVYVGWRILGEEYYDTEYNLYRDGTKVNVEPLRVSNFQDPTGTASSTYTVRPVVRGVEQPACGSATVWSDNYLTVAMGRVYSRRGHDVTEMYDLNDVSAADLDGDGQYELIVKRTNMRDADDLFPVENDSAYVHFEAYKLDGTRLWTIDCGPNMVSGSNVEINLVAYDWDGDGKAELLMRAADGTILPGGVVVGDIKKNYRDRISHTPNLTYMTAGDEFLLYMEGATARLYNQRPFPLKRLEDGETDLKKAWGDDTGHRSNKFFFGAPFLDGRHASIFLARGIYTRHKMVAFDVDPQSHELIERWRWNCNTPGSPWYGQGYHNFGIADVDWDGRDEIVYGSMVIDDNGSGLSTTGLGHGDAQHCGDLDPYRPGQEIFACLEENAGADYRDATTGRIYYRYVQSSDCGRCMAGNFTDDYPGCQMVAGSGFTSSVTAASLGTSWSGITQNFCIYWDGDLCRETMDYTNLRDVQQLGAGTPAVFKYGSATPIFTASGTWTNNYTKGNPGLQCDLLGDWREEMVLRTTDNMALRVYTTIDPTPWPIYTLLHDMQYRQAIVWQMCGYNQPPHLSYFLGKAEGITCPPPPITSNGRVEATDRITSAMNGEHVLLCDPQGGTVTVDPDVHPYILTVNAFSHTMGADDNDHITTTSSTYSLTGAPLTGEMRLVKQGGGTLELGVQDHTYTGETMLWGGTTQYSGTLTASPVWMNRFAELHTDGRFPAGIRMEYGAELKVGLDDGTPARVGAGGLDLNFGAIVSFDVFSATGTSDCVEVDGTLTLRRQTLSGGPQYSAPVFRIVAHPAEDGSILHPGRYLLMRASAMEGDAGDIIVEGLLGVKHALVWEAGALYLEVADLRPATTVYWDGSEQNGTWDLAGVANFRVDGETDGFVTGDRVVFDDAASVTTVNMVGTLLPEEAIFRTAKNYTLTGNGSLSGDARLTMEGSGTLTVNAFNRHTGGTVLAGGTTVVNCLSDEQHDAGVLGGYTVQTGALEIRNGATLQNNVDVSNGVPVMLGEGGGRVVTNARFDMKAPFSGDRLVKSGAGTLALHVSGSQRVTVLSEGTLAMMADGISLGDTLVMDGGTYQDMDNLYSYSANANNFRVNLRKTATINLDSRCTYTGRLYGEGTLQVNVPGVRTQLQGDWSDFEGTLKPVNTNFGLTLDNGYGMPRATLNIPTGVTVTNSGQAFRIGAVTGSGTLGALPPFASSGANTWVVGSADKDFTFGGRVTGMGTALTKVGTGLMKMTGTGDFTGACVVSDGILCLNNPKGTQPMLGTGTLTVERGAMLTGQGVLGNSSVIVESGATLRPGIDETSMSGTLQLGGKELTTKVGSVLSFSVFSSRFHTELADVGTLILRGTLRVTIVPGGRFSEGDEIRLWTAQQYSVLSRPKLELASPGEGLEWDTSELPAGKLKVIKATGFCETETNEQVDCTVYTTAGGEVGRFVCGYADVESKVRMLMPYGGSCVVCIRKEQDMEMRKMCF